ncbi:DUF2946 family protein [Pseudomonas sp. TTU2014-080ASC]|uniref:DUF2946 family protein n=1 Tax=Pseudomonas sp. TTU2014-080ASC TaxID=1729724 RepID=UPI0007185683|nr:DUF2946 family protein [Pseudomonas sp. TTU2014-080ASC]KRW62569.1 hypothetical protein AO726_03890 [Pseudomonas sp. TTU2014-080ASC]
MPTTLARHRQPLLIWMLYFSVLVSSWACALNHGQMTGLSLSGLTPAFCSLHAEASSAEPLALEQHSTMNAAAEPSCMLTSLFSALLLAALFGLLCLLRTDAGQALPVRCCHRAPRDRWPLANPRASPRPLPSR